MSFRAWDGLSFELPGESQWVGLNSLAPYHLPPVEKRPARVSEPEDEMLSAVLRAALTGGFELPTQHPSEPYNGSFCSSHRASKRFKTSWFQARSSNDIWGPIR